MEEREDISLVLRHIVTTFSNDPSLSLYIYIYVNRKLLEPLRVIYNSGGVWKVLEKPRDVHISLH